MNFRHLLTCDTIALKLSLVRLGNCIIDKAYCIEFIQFLRKEGEIAGMPRGTKALVLAIKIFIFSNI